MTPEVANAQQNRITELARQNAEIRDALGLKVATHAQVLAKIRELVANQQSPHFTSINTP